MNVDKWIEENVFETREGDQTILVEDLRELLKHYAIVPREPSNTIIYQGCSKLTKTYPSVNSEMRRAYKAMIKAAE